MNRKQLAYQYARLGVGYQDVYLLGTTIVLGHIASVILSPAPEVNRYLHLAGAASIGGMVGISGAHSLLSFFNRINVYIKSRKIKKNPELYPLENAERIIFEDEEGLEMLLKTTDQMEPKEWATLLNLRAEEKIAVVDRVSDINEAKKSDIFGRFHRDHIKMHGELLTPAGYQGYQHYHPSFGSWAEAMNFQIGAADRSMTMNCINFLTFNMPEGPEIIAFNASHTYIPTDETKNELVLATPKDVLRYLGRS